MLYANQNRQLKNYLVPYLSYKTLRMMNKYIALQLVRMVSCLYNYIEEK